MDYHKIGKFILTLRKEKGFTQQELGEKLSVTDKAVSKWERGLSLPDITLLNSLAEILEVDVSEILMGEHGTKEEIDVQKVIEEEVEKINHERKERQKEWIQYGIIGSIVLLVIGITIFMNFYHQEKRKQPEKIIEGENDYYLENYDLEENGLDKIKEIILRSENMTSKYGISYFEARLNSNGMIQKFTLSLEAFNEDEEFVGNASYVYEKNKITYRAPKDDGLDLVRNYSKSSNVSYVSLQMKQIPLKEQIKLSQLGDYVVAYSPNTAVEIGTPIFDGRDSKEIKALSKEDYNQGLRR